MCFWATTAAVAAACGHLFEFPCGVCGQEVGNDDEGILCDECDLWQHAVCVGIGKKTYRALVEEQDSTVWLCPACLPNKSSNGMSDSPFERSIEELIDSLARESSKTTPSLIKSNHPFHFSFYSTNCRSLLKQIDNLRLIASYFDQPSIIVLCETWLDSSIRPCEVAIPGYQIFRRDRDRHGGGVALYILESIATRKVTRVDLYELLSLEVASKSGLLLIVVVYRPPSSDQDLSGLNDALCSLNLTKYSKVLILWDSNVDLSDPPSNQSSICHGWLWPSSIGPLPYP